jgi:LmbE family N-acetylglucosaminyl deacetylase
VVSRHPIAFTAPGPGTQAETWTSVLTVAGRDPATLRGVRRLVVVSAHPDDESLGAGGLIASATAAGVDVHLVCASDGNRSHPRSPSHGPDVLAARRASEYAEAADRLGVATGSLTRLGLPDGALADHVVAVTTTLVDLVGDGRGTVLASTWTEDGHPDHEAVGRAAAAAARRCEAEHWQFPVWFWHWATPGDPRVATFQCLPLATAARDAKRWAVAAHASQVDQLSAAPGDETLLDADFLAHFAGDHEWFVVTPGVDSRDDELDEIHRDAEDPWGVDSRWYERRKRDLLLATLPRARFASALEVGCSTGALTEALSERADTVLGVDASPTALAAARRRLTHRPGVTLAAVDVSRDWPEGSFDLVVISEVGYFLSPAALDRLVDRVAASLTADGVVVLCHWRHRVQGWVMNADEVHRRFADGPVPPLQARYTDRDAELRVHAATWPAYDR